MQERRVAGVYDEYEHAQEALESLRHSGFRSEDLSVVSPHVHGEDQLFGFTNRSSLLAWGCFYGALWGMPIGILATFLARLSFPVFGPFWLEMLMVILYGVVLGGTAGLILGGLASWSVAPRFFISQDMRLVASKYSAVVVGSEETVRKARDILLSQERSRHGHHFKPSLQAS